MNMFTPLEFSMNINVDDAIAELEKYLIWLTTEGPGIIAAIQRITKAVEEGNWTPDFGLAALEGLRTGDVQGMNQAIGAASTADFVAGGGIGMLAGMTGGLPVAPAWAAPSGIPAQVEIVAAAPDIPGLTSGVPKAAEEPEEILKEVNIMEHAMVTIERQMDERGLALLLARLI